MSGRSTDDIERVRSALPSVAELAERYGISLSGSPGDMRGDAAPFHGGDPSSHGENFSVDVTDDVWRCLRCKSGGSKFEMVAVGEGIVGCAELGHSGNSLSDVGVFREVLEVAADVAGVELSDDRDAGMSEHERDRRSEFDDSRRSVAEFYHDRLDEHGIRSLVKERYGLSDETIDAQLVGYAPPESKHNLSVGAGVSRERLRALGLMRGERPFFRDRIVFPYFEAERGERRVRYFCARSRVARPEGPKYLKIGRGDDVDALAQREPVFGIDSVRGRGEVVVTEGVADALVLRDHGFAAVSPVTTHISGEALEDFWSALRGKEVYVVMDEDRSGEHNAGLKGASKTAHELFSPGKVEPTVCRLPCRNGSDIDVAEWFLSLEADTRAERADAFRRDVLDGEAYPAEVAWWAWGNGGYHHLYNAAVRWVGLDPRHHTKHKDDDGDAYYLSVEDVLEGRDSLRHAQTAFYAGGRSEWSAQEHQQVLVNVVLWAFRTRGSFVQTGDGVVYYHDAEAGRFVQVVPNARGSDDAHREFLNLIQSRFGVSPSQWGRSVFRSVAEQCFVIASERETADVFYADSESGELYVNRFDGHYYAVRPGEPPELRENGSDVLFIPPRPGGAEVPSWEYVPPDERADPESVPGERPEFRGKGDMLARVLCNRINFDEHANLGPSLQRSQLYIHLHSFAFVNELDARPIMAWVGQKGSGKTVVMRSVGQWLFGPEWRESTMPSSDEDFAVKVNDQLLAVVDNYDEGQKWANDILASVATNGAVEKRKLYTDKTLESLRPQCFIALTSRDPPFRRDDVADRCLVFRLDRIPDGFITETEYLRQTQEYRDGVWSAYMDNLSRIMAVREERHDPHRTTTHRLSGWATFAMDTAEALGIPHIDELLGGMQTERAFFALENDPLRDVVEAFIRDGGSGTFTAKELHKKLQRIADTCDLPYRYATHGGVGRGLSAKSDEYRELYGVEIESRHDGNIYRFPDRSGEQGMFGHGPDW